MSAENIGLCGLGFPPKPYTQNINEFSDQLIIKVDCEYNKKLNSSILIFIDILENTVKHQQNEVKLGLAMIRKGESCLRITKSSFHFTNSSVDHLVILLQSHLLWRIYALLQVTLLQVT